MVEVMKLTDYCQQNIHDANYYTETRLSRQVQRSLSLFRYKT